MILDVNERLKQIEIPDLLHQLAPYFELPSYIRTMIKTETSHPNRSPSWLKHIYAFYYDIIRKCVDCLVYWSVSTILNIYRKGSSKKKLFFYLSALFLVFGLIDWLVY